MVRAISDRSQLQERQSTEMCRSGCPGTFPGDARCAGLLRQLCRARRIDDVLVATRNVPEEHSELRIHVARNPAKLVRELRISVMAWQRPSNEAKPVVMFDGREADDDVSKLHIRTETAGRTRTDHGSNGCLLFQQMLSLYGVLGLAVSANREQQRQIVAGMTLEPADS
jgi:hypothetical protein